jgi:hypothetical protein
MDAAVGQDGLRQLIRTEYQGTPGLKLTLCQAGRLWNVPHDLCELALTSLVQTGFLYQAKDGQFHASMTSSLRVSGRGMMPHK